MCEVFDEHMPWNPKSIRSISIPGIRARTWTCTPLVILFDYIHLESLSYVECLGDGLGLWVC